MREIKRNTQYILMFIGLCLYLIGAFITISAIGPGISMVGIGYLMTVLGSLLLGVIGGYRHGRKVGLKENMKYIID